MSEVYSPGNYESLKRLEVVNVPLPDYPTTLTFLFVNHRYPQDLPPNLRELVEAHDMVILEGLGWHQDEFDSRNRISDGDISAQREHDLQFRLAGEKGFGSALNQAIFGTKKPIRYCDLPASKKAREAVSAHRNGFNVRRAISVDHAIALGRNYFSQTLDKFILSRDRYILKNIYPTIDEVKRTLSLESPSALIIYGRGHHFPAEVLADKTARDARGLHQVRILTYGDFDPASKFNDDLYKEYLKGNPPADDLLIKSIIASVFRLTPEEAEVLDQDSGESLRQGFAKLIGKSA